MKLPTIPFRKKADPKYFLSLILRDKVVEAIVLEEKEGKLQIIGEGKASFREVIEASPIDEWLEVFDKAISQAESVLPPNIETQKTIFAVKGSWVVESRIRREYLLKLKKMCESLGLVPIGFLVVTEALSKLLEMEEGAPVSGIIVEIDAVTMTVSLLRGGKLLESKQTKLEDSVPVTIDRLLHHFTNYEVLPSRVVISSAENTEEYVQSCANHRWTKSLPFLHIPQIGSISPEYIHKAVLVGAGTQMGFTTSSAFDVREEETDVPLGGESLLVEGEDTPKTAKAETIEDILPEDHSVDTKDKKLLHEEKISEVSEFGFIREADIGQGKDSKIYNKPEKDDEPLYAVSDVSHPMERGQKTLPAKPALPFLSTLNTSFIQVIKKVNINGMKGFPLLFRRLPGGQGKLIAVVAGILLLFVGLLAWYSMGLRATVVLHINQKVIEQTADVTFSAEVSTDVSQKVIAAESVSVSEDGSVSTDATGKKEVGEKAKGTITLLSSMTKDQTISSGTLITSSNNLVFLTDKDVSIASSSGVSDIKSVQVSVIAKSFGKEYNLPSGTIFSVSGFDKSSVQGKNDSAFSGGSKKDVTVVAKADIDKLAEDIVKSVEDKAKQDMAKSVSGDKELLSGFVSTTLGKKTYSNVVGDEATSVTLQSPVTFVSLTYKKDDVLTVARDTLKNQIESTVVLSNDAIETTIDNIKQKNDKQTTGTIHIKAGLFPKFESAILAKDIAGKSFADAKNDLGHMSQVSNVDILLRPNLPFLPQLLPRLSQNITVEAKAE